MKIKIGNRTFNRKALTNLGLIGILLGFYIGLKIWWKEMNTTALFIILFALLIPSLIRGIAKEIDAEKES